MSVDDAVPRQHYQRVPGISRFAYFFPFFQLQVRLQTMPPPGPGQAPMYAGAIDCVKKTFVTEGVKGFYKGKNQ